VPDLTGAEWAGCAIALLVALVAIYVDCFQRLSKTYANVPLQFFTSWAVFLLAGICAILAGVAFAATDGQGTSVIDKLLSLSIENPYGRGFAVGAAVLVLIRSKLFQLQGGDFGGEFFYSFGRDKALSSVILRWLEWRDAFIVSVLPKSFTTPNFDDTMLDRMKAIAAAASDAEYRAKIEAQIRQIEAAKPTTALNAADPAWILYYRTLTRMTLEVCGRRPFKGIA
jgi:hypothetical protein